MSLHIAKRGEFLRSWVSITSYPCWNWDRVDVMVHSRQQNTSINTTKLDQLITITTQACYDSGGKEIRLGITLSPDGRHSSRLGYIERLVGQLGNGVGNRLAGSCLVLVLMQMLLEDLISHFGGSAMPPAFLDIVAAFALFRRSAINLLIW